MARKNLLSTRSNKSLTVAFLQKWRQTHKLESQLDKALVNYERRLVLRALSSWKSALVRLDRLELTAENFLRYADIYRAREIWEVWKMKTDLNGRERELSAHVRSLLLQSALHRWKQVL